MPNGTQPTTPDRLYELLPATYREQDAQLGEPLRALLRIVQEQADLVEADIQGLWDNFFVETCDPWVVPYLGDLVGNLPLFDAGRVRQPETARALFADLLGPNLVPEVGLRSRADVAKTIYYRRRKGTLPLLEELARDVTGYGAHAVEFFELLDWTQAVRNHLRVHRPGTPDLRRVEPNDRLDCPFDAISHTVDVRPIGQHEGRHNIKNIGFFLWRLGSYEAENIAARPVSSAANEFRYHFSPLGNPAPLFTRWRREGDEAGLANELHVPGPIRPAAFYEDLQAYLTLPLAERPGFSEFYGLFDLPPGGVATTMRQAPASSFVIFRDGAPVPPDKVRCMNLSAWTQPTGEVVGVDVARGRIAFGTTFIPETGQVDVYYHYGFPADLGGGSYRRRAWQVDRTLAVAVLRVQKEAAPGVFNTLADALSEWATRGKPNTIIQIRDSRTYEEVSALLAIEPADGRWLVIEADDGVRPHLQITAGPLTITGDHPDAAVTLSGLLVEGSVEITGSLGTLRLLHTTLVPGRALTPDGLPATTAPSLVAAAGTAPNALRNTRLRVEIAFSITGPLRVPDHAAGLWILDSIVDGLDGGAIAGPPPGPPPAEAPGPLTWLERVTILGTTFVRELTLATEVVFAAPVRAERQQAGCVRFSFVPAAGSVTPRRYRCQPDLEIAARTEEAEKEAAANGTTLTTAQKDTIRAEAAQSLVPTFTTRRYGLPAYAQLHLHCPLPIRTGAEDGSEMGAFCHRKHPQREANLRLRLDEYLPFGLEAGILYVT